jgi:hypothetical protein
LRLSNAAFFFIFAKQKAFHVHAFITEKRITFGDPLGRPVPSPAFERMNDGGNCKIAVAACVMML